MKGESGGRGRMGIFSPRQKWSPISILPLSILGNKIPSPSWLDGYPAYSLHSPSSLVGRQGCVTKFWPMEWKQNVTWTFLQKALVHSLLALSSILITDGRHGGHRRNCSVGLCCGPGKGREKIWSIGSLRITWGQAYHGSLGLLIYTLSCARETNLYVKLLLFWIFVTRRKHNRYWFGFFKVGTWLGLTMVPCPATGLCTKGKESCSFSSPSMAHWFIHFFPWRSSWNEINTQRETKPQIGRVRIPRTHFLSGKMNFPPMCLNDVQYSERAW